MGREASPFWRPDPGSVPFPIIFVPLVSFMPWDEVDFFGETQKQGLGRAPSLHCGFKILIMQNTPPPRTPTRCAWSSPAGTPPGRCELFCRGATQAEAWGWRVVRWKGRLEVKGGGWVVALHWFPCLCSPRTELGEGTSGRHCCLGGQKSLHKSANRLSTNGGNNLSCPGPSSLAGKWAPRTRLGSAGRSRVFSKRRGACHSLRGRWSPSGGSGFPSKPGCIL